MVNLLPQTTNASHRPHTTWKVIFSPFASLMVAVAAAYFWRSHPKGHGQKLRETRRHGKAMCLLVVVVRRNGQERRTVEA